MTILHPTKLFCALATVVQTLDSAIHWINHYPADNAIIIVSRNTNPLDSDLSRGEPYPAFEQPGPILNKDYCAV